MKLKEEELAKKVKVTFMQKRGKEWIRVIVVVLKKSKPKPKRIKCRLIA